MSKNRIKSTTSPSSLSRDQIESLVSDIASLKNNQRIITAKMDDEIQSARDRHESGLAAIADDLKQKTAIVQAWAESNPAEFGKRKSIEFGSGIIGFRTGTPKLKLLLKWKWDMVLQALKAAAWGREYVRTKEEIDKESLIRDAQHPDPLITDRLITEPDLRRIGVQIVQDETFYVEPKLTEVETRQTAESQAA